MRTSTRLVQTCSALLLVGGLSAIAGWQFRIGVLKWQAFGTFVGPNTALLVCLLALSLLSYSERPLRLWISRLLAAAAFAIAGAIAIQYVLPIDTGVDRMFMAHRSSDWYVAGPAGRIALPTSVGLLCASLAVLLAGAGRGFAADIFAAGVGSVSYLGLLGYLFGVNHLYGRVMSLATVVFLAILTVGCFAVGSERPFAMFVSGPGMGSRLFRRVAVATCLIVPLFGSVALWLWESGQFSPEAALAAFAVATIAMVMPIVLRTARALEKANAESERARDALILSENLAATGRMAAAISHEINNPLAAAINLAYLLETDAAGDSSSNSTTRGQLRLLMSELQRVAHITKQTLAFYRGSPERTVVPIAPLVEQVLSSLERDIDEKHVRIERSYDPQLEASVYPVELRQVLLNLLRNAVEAVGDGGRVHIAMAHANKGGRTGLNIVIEDDGPGLAPEISGKLFEPFTTTKNLKGTGLGLWVTRGIVSRHAGSISLVQGSWLPGAAFAVFLPAETSDASLRQVARAS